MSDTGCILRVDREILPLFLSRFPISFWVELALHMVAESVFAGRNLHDVACRRMTMKSIEWVRICLCLVLDQELAEVVVMSLTIPANRLCLRNKMHSVN